MPPFCVVISVVCITAVLAGAAAAAAAVAVAAVVVVDLWHAIVHDHRDLPIIETTLAYERVLV